MPKQGLTILILIAIIFFVVWQYFLPALDEVSSLRETLTTWQAKLSNTQELSRKLEELKKKYDNLTLEANKVAQALPQKEGIPSLLIQLENLSSRNGLILESVAFSAVDEKSDKKNKKASVTVNPEGVKVLAVELNLNGSQKSLEAFLRALETNLRIMDVSVISFGEQDLRASSGQDFKVSVNAYYMD